MFIARSLRGFRSLPPDPTDNIPTLEIDYTPLKPTKNGKSDKKALTLTPYPDKVTSKAPNEKSSKSSKSAGKTPDSLEPNIQKQQESLKIFLDMKATDKAYKLSLERRKKSKPPPLPLPLPLDQPQPSLLYPTKPSLGPPSPDIDPFRRGSHPSVTTNAASQTRKVSKTRLRFLDLAKPFPQAKANFANVDLSLPRLTEALDLGLTNLKDLGFGNGEVTRERRATKAALALRQLILDPPGEEKSLPATTHQTTPTKPTAPKLEESAGKDKGKGKKSKTKIDLKATLRAKSIVNKPKIRVDLEGDSAAGKEKENISSKAATIGGSGKSKTTVSRLRDRDVDRLRTQLLQPTAAKRVIQTARSLPVDPIGAGIEPMRAVCLDTQEHEAEGLIDRAKRVEHARKAQEKRIVSRRFSTLKAKVKPTPPPRLPVLLSLLAGIATSASVSSLTSVLMKKEEDQVLPFGLFQPASAMSLNRPLAGALPSVDTLRLGFDALMNAESKIYQYEGPSHANIHPPMDRISVFTSLPPPTLEYLAHCKSIATSVLNLLSVIVYAVPGGTRELAPFVGVLSRFIESEWKILKAQDKGKGVVCGATWFLPAAVVARPWDFGLTHTERDKLVGFNPPVSPPPALTPKAPIKPAPPANQPPSKVPEGTAPPKQETSRSTPAATNNPPADLPHSNAPPVKSSDVPEGASPSTKPAENKEDKTSPKTPSPSKMPRLPPKTGSGIKRTPLGDRSLPNTPTRSSPKDIIKGSLGSKNSVPKSKSKLPSTGSGKTRGQVPWPRTASGRMIEGSKGEIPPSSSSSSKIKRNIPSTAGGSSSPVKSDSGNVSTPIQTLPDSNFKMSNGSLSKRSWRKKVPTVNGDSPGGSGGDKESGDQGGLEDGSPKGEVGKEVDDGGLAYEGV